jgi:hypothetical protein
VRTFFRRSGLPSDPKQAPEYLARRLGQAYERFLKTAPSNSYAVVDKDGWRLSAEPTEKLDHEGQDRLAHLKSWLAKQMRRVKLPDLLSSRLQPADENAGRAADYYRGNFVRTGGCHVAHGGQARLGVILGLVVDIS